MSLSSSDGTVLTMPVQPAYSGGYGGCNSGSMWGGDWMAFIVLFLLFGMFGWGGFGGWGGGFGGGGGAVQGYATQADIQRGFDNQGVMNKLNGIEQGICSLGYDQLNQMNGINTNILQTGFGIQQAVQADTVANMQNTNALGRQLSDCCCENRAAIAQVRYDMATNNCATITAIDKLGDRIEGRLTTMEMARKDERIAELQSQVNALNLAQSQANQNNYLVNTLRPCPTPTYITCNPWASQAPYGACASYGCAA